MIETLSDVTDRVQLEKIQEEKLTGIIELASAVAHELNTPVFTVLGNAQLLWRQIKPRGPGDMELETIIRNIKMMSRLTQKMVQITEYATKDYVDGEKIFDIEAASERKDEKPDRWQIERDRREVRWLNMAMDHIEIVTEFSPDLKPV